MSFSNILRFSFDPSSITALGITLLLTLMLMVFIHYYFYSMQSSSNSPAPKKIVSTSTSSIQKGFKYDVFLSFRGEDTRKNFVDHLYVALRDKGIYTYKDDVKIKKGELISDELKKAIQDSKFYIIVFSKNYASSSWCLEELVKIMQCHKTIEHTAYSVFYDVEPTEVRNQSGSVRKAFIRNKKKKDAEKWEGALKEAADLAGWELKNTFDGHEAKFIKTIVQEISLELRSINFGFEEKLVGMETRVKDVVSSLEVGIDDVRMIGIKGIGGGGKTTTARAVFDHLSADFEAKSFVENVREVSNGSGLKKLQEQVLSKVLNEQVTLDSVNDGKNMMKRRMCGIKVLLVLDDVDHVEQLKALAGELKWFKPGSRILITTRDEQVLVAHRVNLIRDIVLLSDEEAISLFSRYAFGTENPLHGYEELSGKVVSYAAGLPLTVEVLGSFLCGKGMVEWKDAIDRLKIIPLKETLKKLELSYTSLEDDYKEMFLDIACILKGKRKIDAITIFESCGFHARIGLKVLEQRSLITISHGYLGMHDHIEEMGKNIARRLHPGEPNAHSRLWIKEEIEDILANDMGTEATRCIRLNISMGNTKTLLRGLRKMKKLRYLEVNFPYYGFENDAECLNDTNQYFPNSLEYLKCLNYPFLYLPKTFQANNLVGLEISMKYNSHDMRFISSDILYNSKMVRLWKEGGKKVPEKLKFLSLSYSNLKTFDFTITSNLRMLSLFSSPNLVELYMPASCQNLNYLRIDGSKLRTFDLGLTPNLETFSLFDCTHFVELEVSASCPNLKFLNLPKSRLWSLDLELIPNLERLDLENCDRLVEIKAPIGCLKKVVYLKLSGCLRFPQFVFDGGCEPKASRNSASLDLFGESLDFCPLHPNSNLPKLHFLCSYDENLPSSVGNIEKLISLGLCACTDFKKLSNIICSLQCLRILTLKCNIPEFPKDLGQLECLEELSLYSEKINRLPESICMLKSLKSLNVNDHDHIEMLSDNLLEKLPDDLGQLDSLEKLQVRTKKIEYLPESICMLKRLRSLDVTDCCRLVKLPEDIGQLESLETLVLWATKIVQLPDSICMLKCLKSLDVTGCCHLRKLPEDIGQLESLETLVLTATKIEYLPDSICMLIRLKWLIAGDCCLGKLPEDIGQLESLERLVLTATNIAHLPDSICMLKRLKWLIAGYCCLGKLPEDIGQLQSLEKLDLTARNIKHLPDSICMLKHLKCLILCLCVYLEKLPEDFGRLECLKALDITRTSTRHIPQSIRGLRGLLIAAPPKFLRLYVFSSEIQITTTRIR